MGEERQEEVETILGRIEFSLKNISFELSEIHKNMFCLVNSLNRDYVKIPIINKNFPNCS